MKVVVKLFAGAREVVGQTEIAAEIPENSSVGVLRESLRAGYPALEPLLPHALFAVNSNYASDNTLVQEGAEIAFIPPVSGG